MPGPRHSVLVAKSLQACIAAIEVYNKPDFKYREETFSILILNAWELLLKARVLKENGGRIRSIEVWEAATRKDGNKGRRLRPKRNRSGNAMTIDLQRAAELVRQYPTDAIDERCVDNLRMLMEVRDTAIHFHNVSAGLNKRIQEIGAAALKNYARAAELWFDVDLSRFNFYLMPIAFHSPLDVVESLSAKQPPSVKRLLDYIAKTEQRHEAGAESNYNVALQVQIQFVRAPGPGAIPVQLSRDPTAMKIQVSEEDVLKAFPWSYRVLVGEMRKRYSNFVENQIFHQNRVKIEQDKRFCRIRFLDPAKPASGKKKFYNSNILIEFDRLYARR